MTAKNEYNILFENLWNMDEKGYLLGMSRVLYTLYNLILLFEQV